MTLATLAEDVPVLTETDAVLITLETADGPVDPVLGVAVDASVDAMIVAAPLSLAVTIPVVSTVATDVSLDDQLTVAPLIALWLASRTVAVSCAVPPTVRFNESGLMAILAGCWLTVTATVSAAEVPGAETTTEVAPFFSAITSPVESTEATTVFSTVQVNSTPWIVAPAPSVAVADSWVVAPRAVRVVD